MGEPFNRRISQPFIANLWNSFHSLECFKPAVPGKLQEYGIWLCFYPIYPDSSIIKLRRNYEHI